MIYCHFNITSKYNYKFYLNTENYVVEVVTILWQITLLQMSCNVDHTLV